MNVFDVFSSLEKLIFFGSLGILTIVIIVFIRLFLFAEKLLLEGGYGYLLRRIRYLSVFLLMLLASIVLIISIAILISAGSRAINNLMFFALPYIALIIFLLGSIYRYLKKGFQVSSLSSQFIEGRKLFWGSQPFHWGILVLFFGHLIAFLFPSAIIAWNGQPVRLLILEISAFAFGLLTLAGLILLIRRRFTDQRVLAVASKMDMLVYVILLIQIVSGLSVAFFARWGSTWFAAVLSPYLKSIFLLNPQIDAVSALPWYVQIHILSAFLMIALIPFTRFVHFLVAPVDYIWRNYQLVIWNWNRKDIRNSGAYFTGRKPLNN